MQSYDVIVIGGGLIGCASAFYLSSAGANVALIERGAINNAASGRNAGSLHFQLEHRLIQHKEELTKELEDYVALTKIAINYWQNVEQELDCDLGLVMDGGLMVAETSSEIALLEQKSEIELSQGLDVRLLDKQETHKHAPYLSNDVQASLFCPLEGHCNPRLLTPTYAQQAQKKRAAFYTDAAIQSIYRHDKKWQIDFSDKSNFNSSATHTIRSSSLLNTAGAWAREVAAMTNINLPLYPVPLTMNVTEQVPSFINHLIQHVGRKISIKQVHEGNVLMGGGWAAKLQEKNGEWLSNREALIDMDNTLDNLNTATDIIPRLSNLHLLRTWTGIASLTEDNLPILGSIPDASDYYVAAGGSGFTYGPTYARLMSELILTGRTSFPIEPYTINRFQKST